MKIYTTNKNIAQHYSDQEKWDRMMEGLPRTALPPFLVDFHRRQKICDVVEARKRVRRKRYLRRMRR